MFKFSEEFDLNHISTTGARAIVILGLLTMKPLSLKELRDALVNYRLIDKSASEESLRLDINSLKHVGCDFSRACSKLDGKIILLSHPFALDLSEEDVILLKKVYKKVKEASDIKLLIEFEKLFEKLSKYIFNKDIKEALLGISELKYFETNFIQDLQYAAERQYQLDLVYKTPTANKEVRKQIIAQKLVMQNGKIYLYGYDAEKDKSIVLNIQRILQIFSKTFRRKNPDKNLVNVKFLLNCEKVDLLNDEEIIVEQFENKLIIEASYYNEFIAMQRIMSFGDNCTVIEPLNFKENIVRKLKEMRGVYDE